MDLTGILRHIPKTSARSRRNPFHAPHHPPFSFGSCRLKNSRSGNVFRDFGDPDADIEQLKTLLAAEIIGILDDRKLSTRKAEGLTGVKHSEFVPIRNAGLGRFTADRLIFILNKLG